MVEFNNFSLKVMYIYMGKHKPKLVRHELPECKILFLQNKYRLQLLPSPFVYLSSD